MPVGIEVGPCVCRNEGAKDEGFCVGIGVGDPALYVGLKLGFVLGALVGVALEGLFV